MNSIDRLKTAFFKALKPPPEFSITEWADKYRKLPQVSSSEPGQWRTSRTPYLAEVMQELSPQSHAQEIVFMKGSQIGATEAGLNWLMFVIDHVPAPTLAVQPTVEIAKRYSKQRLTSSINLCQKIRKKVTESVSRRSGNNILQKDFPGGTIMIGGANSAAALRGMPIANLKADEVDGWPSDVEGEGDPLALAIRRTTNFPRRKIFIISTPTIAEESRIDKRFEDSDQRYYFVPCPFCGNMEIIKWENIRFENRDPDTVYLHCVKCSDKIYENHKTDVLSKGEWRKTKPENKIPGFHLSALYSPLGWYSWRQAVKEHLESLTDPQKRQVWVNTVLGETYELSPVTIDADWMMKRCEKYAAPVPACALCLTAGVDTQDDRLEISVYGWGIDNESWLIEHKILFGDTSQAEVWRDLDNYLLTEFEHESGYKIYIACAFVDAMGHRTDEVYAFARDRQFRKVFAIQGHAGSGRPIIGRVTKNKTKKIYLIQVGVDQAKGTLYSRYKIPEPGPGFVHFPKGLDKTFFNQLTAEKRILRRASGMPTHVWTLAPNKRNETLDCAVYALAAFKLLSPNLELLAKENIILTGKPKLKSSRGRRILSKGAS